MREVLGPRTACGKRTRRLAEGLIQGGWRSDRAVVPSLGAAKGEPRAGFRPLEGASEDNPDTSRARNNSCLPASHRGVGLVKGGGPLWRRFGAADRRRKRALLSDATVNSRRSPPPPRHSSGQVRDCETASTNSRERVQRHGAVYVLHEFDSPEGAESHAAAACCKVPAAFGCGACRPSEAYQEPTRWYSLPLRQFLVPSGKSAGRVYSRVLFYRARKDSTRASVSSRFRGSLRMTSGPPLPARPMSLSSPLFRVWRSAAGHRRLACAACFRLGEVGSRRLLNRRRRPYPPP